MHLANLIDMSKRLKEAKAKIENEKVYPIEEAIKLIKETSQVKFDASVEVHTRLGTDPKKGDQIVRDSVILPHGTGKSVKIAAFVPNDRIKEAKDAGADVVGDEEMIAEIKKSGKCDFDLAVTTPKMMKQLSVIARVLGQKGLMPNPKVGTINEDLKKMIGELKKGKIAYKNDTTANIHLIIGKVSFDDKALIENFETFLNSLKKNKPQSLKGTFIKSMTLSSSMGPGIKVSIN
jgi:large subunit ribosomal protein L1